MSEQRKRLLALLGSLFILCACCGGFAFWFGAIFNRAVVTDPAEVEQIGAEIAAYALPAGYSEVMGVNFMRTKTIGIVHDDLSTDMVIFLMQVPQTEGISDAETERQLQVMLQQFNMQPLDFEQDRAEIRVINDQEVEVVYNKGTDKRGKVFNQVMLFFAGHQGKVLLMAQGSDAAWDQEALDTFLDSLR